ncbi:hypothetical protein ACFVSS_16780 [Peribacillus butanolivorans]|uniref:Uncharacterized protein n=1 Tax=Peribacillus simplex TaxID=1478 RepID=A0A8B5Y3T1_9BACI|nr:hypothetical protein [Peribacillus simplex]TVX83709.1 hypothetical protein FQP34_00180 [Peribacillus simplex]
MNNEEKTQRFNMYLNQSLVDGLDILGEQINVPKNSLINVAIAKFLLEMKVLDNLGEPNAAEKKVLKQTDYCNLLNQGRLQKKDHVSTIERIHVKATQEDEIRFAYYKYNKNDNERLILRPLDLTEDDLFQLFISAIAEDVFTPTFRSKLKSIL